MKLKPKNTTLNRRALLYRRYTDLQKSASLVRVYKTEDGKLWLFDVDEMDFTLLDNDIVVDKSAIQIVTAATTLGYLGTIFKYVGGEWTKIDATTSTLTARFGDIAKYQLNKYYYVTSFSYMASGSIAGDTIQPIKGNIMPLATKTIKFFDDNVGLQVDDLLVIGGRLYSVESISADMKHQPRDYFIYFADLNSIV